MQIRIAIVDDKSSNRNILKNKLLMNQQFNVVLSASDGNDFLLKMKELRKENLPEVVLMDLEMPGMDGVEAIASGSLIYPDVKFIVLTIFDDEDKIFRAIKAGAYGYLLKDESAENICDTLLQMYESGAGPVSPGIAFKMLQLVQNNEMTLNQPENINGAKEAFDLTNREQQILQLLVRGLLYKEIGAELGISPNTAKKHVINIYDKLHVQSRTQAIHMAQKKKWL